jgi:hypothetical protein
MTRKFVYFGLFTVAVVGIALCPAVANAGSPYQPGSGSITVIDEWPMGESDSGAVAGGTVTTTVDNIGGLNMTGYGSPTYIAPANSALPASTLGINLNNSPPTVGQYLVYSSAGNFSGAAIAAAGQNWGCDFWFDANSASLTSTSAQEQMLMIGNYGPNNASSTKCVNIAINNSGGNSGLWIANSNGADVAWDNSISANTWYHVVYVDNNGTGQEYFGSGTLTTASLLTGGAPSGGGAAACNYALSSLDANVLSGVRFTSTTGTENSFGGEIDDLRLFTITSGMTFNIADTNPQQQVTYHPGDANEDNRVDINDLTIVLAHYNQTGMVWTQGEFTGDGTVDINDLTIVLANYGWTLAGGNGVMKAVPEPTMLALLAAALTGLVAYGWRKRK